MSRILLLTGLVLGVVGGGPMPASGRDEAPDREDLARVKYLIEMLASKNKAPVVRGDHRRGDDEDISFPKDYDKSLQVPVYLAVQQLLAEGEMALDLLFAHAGDKRYSFSVNSGNMDYNASVSQACAMIAEEIFFPFDREIHYITRSGQGAHPNKPGQTLAEWWKKNERRGLRTVQIEAIDRVTTFMKTVDAQSTLPVHPDANKLPIKEFNRLREDNLRILKSIKGTIVERNQPYRATSLDDDHRYMFGLPWTTRKHNK